VDFVDWAYGDFAFFYSGYSTYLDTTLVSSSGFTVLTLNRSGILRRLVFVMFDLLLD
jgi:hypothetical protein